MADILRIVPNTQKPNLEMIEMVEELLVMAKEGRVTDLAITAHLVGELVWTRASFDNYVRIVGLTASLAHDILHNGAVPEPGDVG